jgi:hypothetical protein
MVGFVLGTLRKLLHYCQTLHKHTVICVPSYGSSNIYPDLLSANIFNAGSIVVYKSK